jgi:hypothetical protein
MFAEHHPVAYYMFSSGENTSLKEICPSSERDQSHSMTGWQHMT